MRLDEKLKSVLTGPIYLYLEISWITKADVINIVARFISETMALIDETLSNIIGDTQWILMILMLGKTRNSCCFWCRLEVWSYIFDMCKPVYVKTE